MIEMDLHDDEENETMLEYTVVEQTVQHSRHDDVFVPLTDDVIIPLRLEKHAVAQAQQEGSKVNFRIFDSPFGNFQVPVVPTHAELSG
ncbi:hypothetical protein L6452_05491 [Arctium lappa]|uniref:Uncharacterized protein n=1 Tax=Arctium lappa TaxID=4217 RepID=A0ACB9EHL5_ARCLA|nr:hypothetical protein L6452_05491 [Arctium lappa]